MKEDQYTYISNLLRNIKIKIQSNKEIILLKSQTYQDLSLQLQRRNTNLKSIQFTYSGTCHLSSLVF